MSACSSNRKADLWPFSDILPSNIHLLNTNPRTKQNVRLFQNTDLTRAEFLLSYTSAGEPRDLTREVHARSTPDGAATFLVQEIMSAYRMCTPISKVSCSHKLMPPVDRETLKLIQKRNALYQNSWRQGDYSKRAQLNRLCNQIRFCLRKERSNWAHNILESVAPTAKGFWSAIRTISNSFRPNLPTLIQGDNVAVTDQKKADLFSSELQNNFSQSQFPPMALSLSDSDLSDQCVSKFDIEKCIGRLSNSAPGPDGIPPAFLKALKSVLAAPLAGLLQMCLTSGQFPSNFKTAQITPIPKVSGSNDPSDYRPISVTSAISKVFEYWILTKISPSIVPSLHQFGFRKRCGTEDAICNLQHQVAQGLDSCPRAAHVLIVSVDIFRAFDQVNHNLLFTLLLERLVPTPFLRILASFFSNRFQFVKVGLGQSALSISSLVQRKLHCNVC